MLSKDGAQMSLSAWPFAGRIFKTMLTWSSLLLPLVVWVSYKTMLASLLMAPGKWVPGPLASLNAVGICLSLLEVKDNSSDRTIQFGPSCFLGQEFCIIRPLHGHSTIQTFGCIHCSLQFRWHSLMAQLLADVSRPAAYSCLLTLPYISVSMYWALYSPILPVLWLPLDFSSVLYIYQLQRINLWWQNFLDLYFHRPIFGAHFLRNHWLLVVMSQCLLLLPCLLSSIPCTNSSCPLPPLFVDSWRAFLSAAVWVPTDHWSDFLCSNSCSWCVHRITTWGQLVWAWMHLLSPEKLAVAKQEFTHSDILASFVPPELNGHMVS